MSQTEYYSKDQDLLEILKLEEINETLKLRLKSLKLFELKYAYKFNIYRLEIEEMILEKEPDEHKQRSKLIAQEQKDMKKKLETVQQELNLLKYKKLLKKQNKLKQKLNCLIPDSEILSAYVNESKSSDLHKLYKITNKLIKLNYENMVHEFESELLQFSIDQSNTVRNIYLIRGDEAIIAVKTNISGDGWCALSAVGIEKPKEVIEDLITYITTSTDNEVKEDVMPYIQKSLIASCILHNSKGDILKLKLNLDDDGNDIMKELERLNNRMNSWTNKSSKQEISMSVDRFENYSARKDVQVAYLTYLLKSKYADPNIASACLAYIDRNKSKKKRRRIALLADYGCDKLVNLSEDDVDLLGENTIGILYQPHDSPLLSHYDSLTFRLK